MIHHGRPHLRVIPLVHFLGDHKLARSVIASSRRHTAYTALMRLPPGAA